MIDLESVGKLEHEALAKRIAKEKLDQETDQKMHRESHSRLLLEIENQKQEVEKILPNILKQLNQDITYAIQRKSYSVEFSCGEYSDNEWRTMHIKIMLIQMLSLKGFACRFSKENFRSINISW